MSKEEADMKSFIAAGSIFFVSMSSSLLSQEHHMEGMHDQTRQPKKMLPRSNLKAAEGQALRFSHQRKDSCLKAIRSSSTISSLKGKEGSMFMPM
jgi:hypothetical protein